MNKKKIIIIITILILLSVGGYYYWSSRNVVLGEVIKPEINTVQKTVSASGLIKSEIEADLAFAATGKILKINVKEGEEVTKNQLLAVLDTESSRQSAQSLKDSRDAAKRDRDLFIEQYGNNKNDIGGEAEYDIRLRKYDELISQAQASYASQNALIRNYYIYAPFDGTIIDIAKEVGEIATATEIIIKVADMTKLYFAIELDQEDFGIITKSEKANIELDTYPDIVFDALIYEKPSYAKTLNSGEVFEYKLKISNSNDKPILYGMNGDAEIIAEATNEPVQTLIFDEIYQDEKFDHYVWILDEKSMLSKKYIDIGLEGDIYTEVKTDLAGNTIVIPLDKTQKFDTGVKVKLVSE